MSAAQTMPASMTPMMMRQAQQGQNGPISGGPQIPVLPNAPQMNRNTSVTAPMNGPAAPQNMANSLGGMGQLAALGKETGLTGALGAGAPWGQNAGLFGGMGPLFGPSANTSALNAGWFANAAQDPMAAAYGLGGMDAGMGGLAGAGGAVAGLGEGATLGASLAEAPWWLLL